MNKLEEIEARMNDMEQEAERLGDPYWLNHAADDIRALLAVARVAERHLIWCDIDDPARTVMALRRALEPLLEERS